MSSCAHTKPEGLTLLFLFTSDCIAWPITIRYSILYSKGCKTVYNTQGSKGIRQWWIKLCTLILDDAQNYPFFILQLGFETFGYST